MSYQGFTPKEGVVNVLLELTGQVWIHLNVVIFCFLKLSGYWYILVEAYMHNRYHFHCLWMSFSSIAFLYLSLLFEGHHGNSFGCTAHTSQSCLHSPHVDHQRRQRWDWFSDPFQRLHTSETRVQFQDSIIVHATQLEALFTLANYLLRFEGIILPQQVFLYWVVDKFLYSVNFFFLGTGIVTSVPSDAPDDYAALRDVKKKAVSKLLMIILVLIGQRFVARTKILLFY